MVNRRGKPPKVVKRPSLLVNSSPFASRHSPARKSFLPSVRSVHASKCSGAPIGVPRWKLTVREAVKAITPSIISRNPSRSSKMAATNPPWAMWGAPSLVSLPFALLVWQPMSLLNWMGILVIGVAATLGHVTLMRSFAGPMWAAQAGKYIQLLFVILFGIALFDEIPTASTLLGALVVLGGVSYIAMREGRRNVAQNGAGVPVSGVAAGEERRRGA